MENGQFRPRLSQSEWDLVQQYRDKHKLLTQECEKKGIPVGEVSSYWVKDKHISINVKSAKEQDYFTMRDSIVSEMQLYAPEYPEIIRNVITEGHLLVVDPADIHIGKLARAFETGEEYNNQIAVQRVKEGVQGLLDKSTGFNIEKILLIIGNDMLHIDTPARTTTNGTKQDTEGMWYENFLIAKKLYIEIIELLVTVADVHIQYDPSNHDYSNGFFLADAIASWFAYNQNVTSNVSISHRKYFEYGENLIGTSHGDEAKSKDLPLLMANEAAQAWARCRHRYFYTHHIHHKDSKDYMSVCVESLRSPSSADSWHHRNGYQHAPKAIEGFIHHPRNGQVARITHIF